MPDLNRLTTLLVPLLIAGVGLTGCSRIVTEPNTETVLVDKPYVFGKGGVRDETQKPGAGIYWMSTEGIQVTTAPMKIDEGFEHLITAGDNIPVNFSSYLQVQITDPISVIKQYGPGWYENNLKEAYRTIVRNEAKKYSMNQILSDAATIVSMESNILAATKAMAQSAKLPIAVLSVNLGKVTPDQKILAEINETGRQKQRSKTMEAAREAEDQRKAAETARANADNAYRNAMGLSADQFVRLEEVKNNRLLYEKCGEKCTVIVSDGRTPVLANTR